MLNPQDDYYIDLLAKIADAGFSGIKHKQAAAIVENGKVISIAVNKRKWPPVKITPTTKYQSIYFHAEERAIMKAVTSGPFSPGISTIYVTRILKTDSKMMLANSKPCAVCLQAISNAKIGTLVYSTTDLQGKFITQFIDI